MPRSPWAQASFTPPGTYTDASIPQQEGRCVVRGDLMIKHTSERAPREIADGSPTRPLPDELGQAGR